MTSPAQVDEYLGASGWTHEFVPFHGGHEVPKDVHAKAVAYFMGK